MFVKSVFAAVCWMFLALCLSCDAVAIEHIEFPKPTGCHAVGTKLLYMVDRDRIDPETQSFRQLVVQVWYPAESGLSTPSSPYASEAITVLENDLVQNGCDAKALGTWIRSICTYAIPEAPICHDKQRYPLIFFGHGYATPRGFYATLCEELASHGYVVCMVMHTYATGFTRFADGTETNLMRERSFELLSECAIDIKFVLDSLQNGAIDEIAQYCDFRNIGMVGHSMGGMLASLLCARDDRIKAGISLDGPLLSGIQIQSIQKPFLFLIAPTFYEMFTGESDFLSTDLDLFCRNNRADSYKIVLKNAGHNTFSDYSVWKVLLRQFFHENNVDIGSEKIDGFKAVEITRSYICVFFDKYLRGRENRLLEENQSVYANDVDFSSWHG